MTARPRRRLSFSTHSSRVWRRSLLTVPTVWAQIPSESGMFASVEDSWWVGVTPPSSRSSPPERTSPSSARAATGTTSTTTINTATSPVSELEVSPTADNLETTGTVTAGTAVVTLSAPVDDAVLKSTVEAKDYKVTGIA